MIKTTSADGTAIAADRTGSGPALVLVAPALGTRAAFTPLAVLLDPHFTVYADDRRGRGSLSIASPGANGTARCGKSTTSAFAAVDRGSPASDSRRRSLNSGA